MFNSEEDYLEDIAILNNRIEALKAENEYLKREVRQLMSELDCAKSEARLSSSLRNS